MTRDDCILLGSIAKIHGVRGELIIRTTNPSFDLKENWESIFLQIDGILVPFFISGLKAFKPGEWVLKLDWYDTRNQAEKLVGYPVWIQKDWMEPVGEEIFMDELIGFKFVDAISAQQGTIVDFMDIPDNPVFEVKIGREKKLIPAREELILEVDTEKRQITMEVPDGLF
ncbi:ribosome maturation factor RimM [Bacteroidota bacterium]